MFQIAVCDDEKIFVERISEIVKAFFKEQKLECQVDEFYSGEEFVELKEEVGKYDIVFLDMQMDKMNGIETAKYLRKYGEDTFLVFVTAYAEYAATGYQVQATWFVIKDYDKMEAAGVISPVLTVEAAYHSMTRYGEEVSIEVTVKKYNGVKIFLGYHIRDKKDGTLRCSGQTSHCFLNREGKPLSLKKEKPEWHEILKRECERAQEQNG